jgi:hypothetical protein
MAKAVEPCNTGKYGEIGGHKAPTNAPTKTHATNLKVSRSNLNQHCLAILHPYLIAPTKHPHAPA